MKKQILIIAILILGQMQAQTGIGTTTPNASAKLDVYATNKGFLPPRVTLTSATDATTIAAPAEGLLVYNLGSSGLQAGYYYWNGANWATIATATSAGNGVTASDMVKIYDGVGNAATINSTGATFSVTTSGKYLFDISTSATCNNCMITLNFQVRDGSNSNAVIGSDYQTSWNNNVHAEYNGKVEVNLIAGRSYNVLVTASSGGIYNSDYTRVYMKQVSGNLPVTGQTVEYGIARYSGADGSAIADNAIVPFDATASGNLTWSGNKFTLKANKTYELESSLAIYISNSAVAGRFQIYDYTNSVALANGLFMSQNGAGSNGQSANSPMKGIITPTSDIQVGIRLLDHYGANGPAIIGNAATTGVQSAANASYFMVKQIGSSAIVNPWILSGNDVYNNTGKVGIGNTAPTQALDVTGNVNISGKINVNDPSGNVVLKSAGFVNAGVPITFGDIQVIMSTGGSRSLQIRTTGSNFTGMVSAYTTYSNSAFTHFSDVTQTINGIYAYLGTSWSFGTDGDVANYFVRDTTNGRFYRITLMVGVISNYTNNFISIERLL